jgi:hypothetical protein
LFVYSLLEKIFKMTKRRYVPRKKLGNKRIDLPLTKKKEYLKRIITLKQPNSEVKKIYILYYDYDNESSDGNDDEHGHGYAL